ncbi:MAG: hypothetical protein H5U17_00860 [Defluviimonas sp.]|nr:hypothetical protein [Defluviimonas sp.]
MTRHMMLGAALAVSIAAPAAAGPISSACLASGRPGATPQLCGCIQQVADQTLSRGDQRAAARFFRDPHQAQEVRQSGRPRDEAFWLRYRDFGARAEARCS